jgi:hypothetical protein
MFEEKNNPCTFISYLIYLARTRLKNVSIEFTFGGFERNLRITGCGARMDDSKRLFQETIPKKYSLSICWDDQWMINRSP